MDITIVFNSNIAWFLGPVFNAFSAESLKSAFLCFRCERTAEVCASPSSAKARVYSAANEKTSRGNPAQVLKTVELFQSDLFSP
jgi:hypothetical protein